MTAAIWGIATITVTTQREMCDEELIALTLACRGFALSDDNYSEHYILIREVCWKQTGVDVAVLGLHMDRLAAHARAD